MGIEECAERYSLLLVDDEAIIREGVGANVPWGQLGYTLVGTCQDGREAYAFLREREVDVVITDVSMPFLDGMGLAAKIAEEFPQTRVLILSGYDDFSYAKQAIKYGVEEYLLKPITSSELSQVLGQLREKMDKQREEQRRRDKIYSSYRKNRLLIASEALVQLLSGAKGQQEAMGELEQVGIYLPQGPYMVGVARLGEEGPVPTGGKNHSLMSFILFNLCKDILDSHQAGQACQGREGMTHLLLAPGSGGEERAHAIAEEILAKVAEVMGRPLHLGLGSLQPGLDSLPLSFEQSLSALEAGLYRKGSRGLTAIGELEESPLALAQVERISDNILRRVRESDRQKLAEDMEELRHIFNKGGLSNSRIRAELEALASRVEKLAQTLARGRWEGDGGAWREAGSLPSQLEALGAWIDSALCFVEGQTGGSDNSLAYRGMAYIEENYANRELNLQKICSHLGVSASRFSSLFKQAFGSTFVDVLIGIRMQKAKELLEMSELRTYEIASRVGFADPHYFSIAFKKATGMTPTEYARSKKRGGRDAQSV